MPNYEEAKIYALRSNLTDKIYIGSTTQPLYKRFHSHRRMKDVKTLSASIMFQFNDVYIELIEKYSCKDKDELTKREGEIIRENKDDCVNLRIAGRSFETYKQEERERYLESKRKYNKKQTI